tara:strand:- start:545 stop:982 length:438 start_codon:yes stop_codon:yes gene_type:complete
MITIKKISKSELPKLVAISYEKDEELFDKYHIGKMDFPSAVLSTLDLIHEASQELKLSYYKVIYQKQSIGYFVTFDGYLYSFGISMKYRKREILIGWFDCIKKVLGKNFRAMLYDNNTRAIKHLEKQGMQIIDFDEETKIVTLQK